MISRAAALITLAISCAMAQQKLEHITIPHTLPPAVERVRPSADAVGIMPNAEPTPQALTFSTLFSPSINALFAYAWPGTSPIAYDPISGVLAIVELVAQTNQTTNDLGSQLVFRYSTNRGSTWSRQVLVNNATIFYGMPQIGIANPSGSTNASDLKVMLAAYRYPKDNNYMRRGTALFARIDPSQIYEYDQPGPTENNPDGYLFGAGKLIGFSAGADRSGMAYCGILSPPSDAVQYGQYGSFVANARFGDVTDFVGSIPSAWNNNQFRAAPARTSTYNSPMYVGADADGKLYAVVNALFADDENNRVLAVSTSSDMGQTWSSFERMPASVLQAYANNRGAALAVPFRVYDQSAMVVTGTNRFSYISRIALFADQTTLSGIDLVETEYDNGNWTMRTIAPINDIMVTYAYNDSAMQARNYQQLVCDEILSPLGNEIEVARTADGSAIVVKWVDAVPSAQPIVLSSPQAVLRYDQQTGEFQEEIQVDTLPVFNIFMASRALSANSWTTPMNLTGDNYYHKGTHIPMIVPSLDQIPLMTNLTPTSWSTQSNIGRVLSQSPQDFVNRIINIPNNVGFARANISNVEPVVRMPQIQLVVAPSPASDQIEVAASGLLDGGQLTVVNTLGQVVRSESIGASDGIRGMTLDVHSLPAGAYRLLLHTHGRVVATAPLTIVR